MTWIDYDLMDWSATKMSTRRAVVAVGDAGVWNDYPSREFRIRSNTGWGGYVSYVLPEIGENAEINPNSIFHPIFKSNYQPILTQIRFTAKTAEAQPTANLLIKTETNDFATPDSVWMTTTPTSSSEVLNITSNTHFSKIVAITEDGSGAKIDILKVELNITEPTYENTFQKAFIVSLNQLVRLYNPTNGLVMNLGWFSAHSDMRIPAMGAGLALGLACGVDLQICHYSSSRTIAYNAIQSFIDSPRYNNWTAHFTDNGGILSWSEYSTVDTSIGIFSAILASLYFGFDDHYNTLMNWVESLDFNAIRNNRQISHGYDSSGNLLSNYWGDWGGEEALIQMLQWLNNKKNPSNKLTRSGIVYNKIGFIGELTALFFRPFALGSTNDKWNINWQTMRENLRQDHINQGTSELFGLSATEIVLYDGFGVPYTAYNVAGASVPNPGNGVWISPHYTIMSSSITTDTSGLGIVIEPLQILESVRVDGVNSNNIQFKHVAWSSLNCFFNTISSYHSYCRSINKGDMIYSLSSLYFKNSINNYFPKNRKITR